MHKHQQEVKYTIKFPSKRKELIIFICVKGKRKDFRQIYYTFVASYCIDRMNMYFD